MEQAKLAEKRDVLLGRSADDMVHGEGGDDFLCGGTGRYTLDGGTDAASASPGATRWVTPRTGGGPRPT
ncbi:hypothetical protein AB0M42_20945 [Streptomyces sp. NPDC051784]|uniref:hypothetical protein n=1 Tax=Streptomyces sp. NPDC051784 TaxID=3155805 RepID=UPI0034279D23